MLSGLICAVLAVATILFARQVQQLQEQVDAQRDEISKLQADARESRTTASRGGGTTLTLPPVADVRGGPPAVVSSPANREPSGDGSAPPPPEVVAGRTGRGGGSTDGVSWLERLREDDPERYERIQKEREERRQRLESRMAEQYARLDQRLQTAQTKEEADLVTSLANTLNQMNDVRTKWESIGQLPEDQRQQKFQELIQQSGQLYQSYSALREQDRQLQLHQLASQIGYQNTAEATQFIEAVSRIYRETDTSMRGLFGFNFGTSGGGRRGERNRPSE
jgi:hypothetical protein